MSVINTKKIKKNVSKKRRQLKKIKKFLIVRVHDNIKPIPDFPARPTNCPITPSFCCRLGQILTEILRILTENNDEFDLIIVLKMRETVKF